MSAPTLDRAKTGLMYVRIAIATPILFILILLEATIEGLDAFWPVFKDGIRHIGRLWKGTL